MRLTFDLASTGDRAAALRRLATSPRGSDFIEREAAQADGPQTDFFESRVGPATNSPNSTCSSIAGAAGLAEGEELGSNLLHLATCDLAEKRAIRIKSLKQRSMMFRRLNPSTSVDRLRPDLEACASVGMHDLLAATGTKAVTKVVL